MGTVFSIGAVTSLAWAAVPLSNSSRDFSALSQTSISTSTPALFTAISIGAVTSLAATRSAALVGLLCTYGTGLYTGLTRNMYCTVVLCIDCTVCTVQMLCLARQ